MGEWGGGGVPVGERFRLEIAPVGFWLVRIGMRRFAGEEEWAMGSAQIRYDISGCNGEGGEWTDDGHAEEGMQRALGVCDVLIVISPALDVT